MKFVVIFLLFSLKTLSCEIGNDSTCSENQHCVFTHQGQPAKCIQDFMGTPPTILFPFISNHPVKCWKSNGKLENSSHAWNNALYAIDLHSAKDRLGIIRSGLAGRVISFTGCLRNSPQCNSAFGNQVKIFSDNGIMLYYVHLSEVYVKSGDYVNIGQPIGVEGSTGNVGGMWGEENDFHHLHMSVHSDWRKFDENFHQNTWPGIDSIPFKFILKNNKVKDIRDIKCSKFHDDPEILFGAIL